MREVATGIVSALIVALLLWLGDYATKAFNKPSIYWSFNELVLPACPDFVVIRPDHSCMIHVLEFRNPSKDRLGNVTIRYEINPGDDALAGGKLSMWATAYGGNFIHSDVKHEKTTFGGDIKIRQFKPESNLTLYLIDDADTLRDSKVEIDRQDIDLIELTPANVRKLQNPQVIKYMAGVIGILLFGLVFTAIRRRKFPSKAPTAKTIPRKKRP